MSRVDQGIDRRSKLESYADNPGNPLLTVLLQPMKEDPPASAKCKDKFLVQSTFITPERENVSLADIVSYFRPTPVHVTFAHHTLTVVSSVELGQRR